MNAGLIVFIDFEATQHLWISSRDESNFLFFPNQNHYDFFSCYFFERHQAVWILLICNPDLF